MVRAVATCTCKTCGNQFEKITFKQNRRLADSWVEWAEETLDECPQCYGKKVGKFAHFSVQEMKVKL